MAKDAEELTETEKDMLMQKLRTHKLVMGWVLVIVVMIAAFSSFFLVDLISYKEAEIKAVTSNYKSAIFREDSLRNKLFHTKSIYEYRDSCMKKYSESPNVYKICDDLIPKP